MNEAVVWWLLIYAGGTMAQPPVFVPQPYLSLEQCNAAGEVFKESPMDTLEDGMFVCLPGNPTHTDQSNGRGE